VADTEHLECHHGSFSHLLDQCTSSERELPEPPIHVQGIINVYDCGLRRRLRTVDMQMRLAARMQLPGGTVHPPRGRNAWGYGAAWGQVYCTVCLQLDGLLPVLRTDTDCAALHASTLEHVSQVHAQATEQLELLRERFAEKFIAFKDLLAYLDGMPKGSKVCRCSQVDARPRCTVRVLPCHLRRALSGWCRA
jgi:hypothetical protein